MHARELLREFLLNNRTTITLPKLFANELGNVFVPNANPSPHSLDKAFLGTPDFREKRRGGGGWKTQGRGKHTIKTLPPKKRFWTPPPMIPFPLPLFTPCHFPWRERAQTRPIPLSYQLDLAERKSFQMLIFKGAWQDFSGSFSL